MSSKFICQLYTGADSIVSNTIQTTTKALPKLSSGSVQSSTKYKSCGCEKRGMKSIPNILLKTAKCRQAFASGMMQKM